MLHYHKHTPLIRRAPISNGFLFYWAETNISSDRTIKGHQDPHCFLLSHNHAHASAVVSSLLERRPVAQKGTASPLGRDGSWRPEADLTWELLWESSHALHPVSQ